MKTLVLFAIPAVLLFAADQKATNKAPATQETAKPAATVLPKGAVLAAPYTYKYTDAQGKKWLYRETPFGLVKLEDKPAEPIVDNAGANPTVVTDLGEKVKFERKTPFGVQNWTKKKADLTDDEKALLSPKTQEKQ